MNSSEKTVTGDLLFCSAPMIKPIVIKPIWGPVVLSSGPAGILNVPPVVKGLTLVVLLVIIHHTFHHGDDVMTDHQLIGVMVVALLIYLYFLTRDHPNDSR